MITIGIDFGTSGIRASCILNGKATVIPNMYGKDVTTAVVTIDDNNEIAVGEIAEKRLLTHPHMTAGNIKRYIGRNKEFNLGEYEFSAEELASLLLNSIRQDAEDFLSEECTKAVISIPSYYDHFQRIGLIDAAKCAGFKQVDLINESAACALTYADLSESKEMQFIVMTIGAGSFDISIFYLTNGKLHVHSIGGDNSLGGEDFTYLLEQHFINKTGIIKEELNESELALIHAEAEKCKLGLSDNMTESMSVNIKGLDYTVNVTNEEFEVISNKLLKRIKYIVEETLEDADVRLIWEGEIESVVITGGAMNTFIIKDVVQKMFNSVKCVELDSDKCIAYGAALQGGFNDGKYDADNIITINNICPHAMLMKTTGKLKDQKTGHYYFNSLISANASIPVLRTKKLYADRNNQYDMEVGIYKADNSQGKNSVLLGRNTIKLPKCLKDEEVITINYSCDNNGVFNASAVVNKTNEEINLVNHKDDNFMLESRKRLRKLDHIKTAPRIKYDHSFNTKNLVNIDMKLLHNPYENHVELVEEFIEKVQGLYDDFFNRIDISKWDKLLCSDAVWNLENSEDLSMAMIKFLMNHYHLPEEVWKRIEETFNLNNMKTYMERKYPHDFERIIRVFDYINNNKKLRYSYFKSGQDVNYDEFIEYRDQALDSLISEEYEDAEEFIKRGEYIFDKDPDMTFIKGLLYMETQRSHDALECFNKVIEMDHNNLSARFYRAKVCLADGMIKEALNDCSYIEEFGGSSYVNNGPDIIYIRENEHKTTEFNNMKSFKAMYVKCLYNMDNLKENKDLNEKLNEIYKELGVVSHKNIQRKAKDIIIKRLFLCFMIFAVQFSFMNYGVHKADILDSSFQNSIKKICRYVGTTKEITYSKEIIDDNMECAKVKGTLDNASFLGLYRISKGENTSKKSIEYLSIDEAKERDVYSYSDGYICKGTIGNNVVVLITNYEDAQEIYKNKSLEFEGVVYRMDQKLINKIADGTNINEFDKDFVTEAFIDTSKKLNNMEFALSFSAFLLLLQIIFILQGISAVGKLKKENHNKIINL